MLNNCCITAYVFIVSHNMYYVKLIEVKLVYSILFWKRFIVFLFKSLDNRPQRGYSIWRTIQPTWRKTKMKEKLKASPEEKTKAFAEAIDRIGLQTAEACRIFGCTRQTFANWTSGRTKVPDAAFLALICHENEQYRIIQERREEIADVVRRLNGK